MATPKTLIFDIETTPLKSWTWGTYQQNVLKVDEDWGILCFAYKWQGDKNIKVVARPDFEKEYAADPDNDLKVVEELWHLFDESEILLAHNGEQFDIKKARTRFLIQGFAPPSPSGSIDTLKMARRQFAFASNRLNDLGQFLGVGKKINTGGFELWLDVMNGDPKAWALMKRYCAQDVRLLSDVFDALQPWSEGGPNYALLTGGLDSCPKCGGRLTKQGYRRTRTMTYQQYQCQDCGGWSRGRLAEKTLQKPMAID